jgi:hypothetical protein
MGYPMPTVDRTSSTRDASVAAKPQEKPAWIKASLDANGNTRDDLSTKVGGGGPRACKKFVLPKDKAWDNNSKLKTALETEMRTNAKDLIADGYAEVNASTSVYKLFTSPAKTELAGFVVCAGGAFSQEEGASWRTYFDLKGNKIVTTGEEDGEEWPEITG